MKIIKYCLPQHPICLSLSWCKEWTCESKQSPLKSRNRLLTSPLFQFININNELTLIFHRYRSTTIKSQLSLLKAKLFLEARGRMQDIVAMPRSLSWTILTRCRWWLRSTGMALAPSRVSHVLPPKADTFLVARWVAGTLKWEAS